MEGLKGLSLFLLVSLGVLLMVVAGAEDAEGATITVPDDFATIQEAIDNAMDYDTLFIKDGLYIESVVVDRPLTLIGESQAGTVIESNDPYGVLIVANRVSLSSVTVQGTAFGAGLTLQASNCVIEDVTVKDWLWGLWIYRAYHNVVRNVQCLNNSWQGVLVEEADETLLQDVTCKDNNDGIHIRAAVDTTLEDCTMIENRVHGLLVQRLYDSYETEDVTVLDCIMSNNSGNGGDFSDTDGVTVEGCVIEDNAWSAIRFDRCNDVVVRGCQVRNFVQLGISFQGDGSTGGCVIEDNFVTDEATAWSMITMNGVEDCIIRNNYVSGRTRAIVVYVVNNTLVSDNELVSRNDNASIYTRGVIVGRHRAGPDQRPTNVTLLRNEVRNFSEGMWVRGGWDIDIIDCTFEDCRVGIAFVVFDYGDDPIVGGMVKGCNFDGCGLVIEGMIDVMVENNLIMASDVGIYFNATTHEIMDNEFKNNTIRDCGEYGMRQRQVRQLLGRLQAKVPRCQHRRGGMGHALRRRWRHCHGRASPGVSVRHRGARG
jgi:nitrous oxidase accessory protein NosD